MTSPTGEESPRRDVQLDQKLINLDIAIDRALADLPDPVFPEEILKELSDSDANPCRAIGEAEARVAAEEDLKSRYLEWLKQSVIQDITSGNWGEIYTFTTRRIKEILADERYSAEAFIKYLYALWFIEKLSYTD